MRADRRSLTRAATALQARKLEGEIDVKLAAFGKLCSGFEYGYTKGESGLATEQARARVAAAATLPSRSFAGVGTRAPPCCVCCAGLGAVRVLGAERHQRRRRPSRVRTPTRTYPHPHLHSQLLQVKTGELGGLLARLGDTNDRMRSSLAGGADARSHTLARHRDILHDYGQEFK